MAYLNMEFSNAKLIWANIGDRVVVAGAIIFGIVASSKVASMLLYNGAEIILHP